MQQLLREIDNINDYYVDVWKKVCSIESPTAYKEGVDAVGALFTEIAENLGFDIECQNNEKAGNALCFTLNKDSKEQPVVFSGHIDTVFPIGLIKEPLVHTDDRCIYGPGVMDCKGGVVAGLMAMDALKRCNFKARPVKLIIQTDEETSSKTSGKKTIEFMIEKAKNAIAFLNTEGTEGDTAVLVRKGILRYRFTVLGKAVHSSRCAEGANAVAEASHKIIKLEEMKDVNGITCNCGVIQGGTVANTVAEKCEFVADIRFVDEDSKVKAEKTVSRIAEETAVSGCTCLPEKISERPAMPLVEKNAELLQRMNKIYLQCGLPELKARKCLGGSDAAYTTKAGIPTIDSVGVDGENIHSVNEFAYLDSLAASAKRLAAVAYNI